MMPRPAHARTQVCSSTRDDRIGIQRGSSCGGRTEGKDTHDVIVPKVPKEVRPWFMSPWCETMGDAFLARLAREIADDSACDVLARIRSS